MRREIHTEAAFNTAHLAFIFCRRARALLCDVFDAWGAECAASSGSGEAQTARMNQMESWVDELRAERAALSAQLQRAQSQLAHTQGHLERVVTQRDSAEGETASVLEHLHEEADTAVQNGGQGGRGLYRHEEEEGYDQDVGLEPMDEAALAHAGGYDDHGDYVHEGGGGYVHEDGGDGGGGGAPPVPQRDAPWDAVR